MSVQADCLDRLEEGWIRGPEQDLVRWALNAKWSKPLRAQKKRLPLLVYKRASALEVLVRLAEPLVQLCSYEVVAGCIC